MVKKYKLIFTRQAQRDAKRISSTKLKPKVIKLLEILSENPFQVYPPYEKLLGDLTGTYSRRINIQHRLVYQVLQKKKIVKVIIMWTHFE